MVVLRPDLSEDEWEEELARFESSLDKAGVTEIDSLVRGRQRMAYPINGCVYGLFVLYTFIGDHSVGRAVQKVRGHCSRTTIQVLTSPLNPTRIVY